MLCCAVLGPRAQELEIDLGRRCGKCTNMCVLLLSLRPPCTLQPRHLLLSDVPLLTLSCSTSHLVALSLCPVHTFGRRPVTFYPSADNTNCTCNVHSTHAAAAATGRTAASASAGGGAAAPKRQPSSPSPSSGGTIARRLSGGMDSTGAAAATAPASPRAAGGAAAAAASSHAVAGDASAAAGREVMASAQAALAASHAMAQGVAAAARICQQLAAGPGTPPADSQAAAGTDPTSLPHVSFLAPTLSLQQGRAAKPTVQPSPLRSGLAGPDGSEGAKALRQQLRGLQVLLLSEAQRVASFAAAVDKLLLAPAFPGQGRAPRGDQVRPTLSALVASDLFLAGSSSARAVD